MYDVEMVEVSKKYKTKEVLENINFKLEKHKILGIVGPNGAGKTTLIRVIMRLLSPTSGQCIVLDSDKMEDIIRSKIGFCLDSDGIYKNLTGRENLEFIARVYNLKDYHNKIDELAAYLDIKEVLDRRVQEYSKGMIKKILIIRSLLIEPSLVILDEPMTGLDIESQAKVMELLSKKSKNTTIIISSHILSQIEKLCDEVMILNKTIKYYGEIKNLNLGTDTKLKVTFKQKPEKKLVRDIKLLEFVNQVEEKDNELIIEYNSESSYVENDIIKIVMQYPKLAICNVEHVEKDIENLYYESINA